jgi:hypothetical protein
MPRCTGGNPLTGAHRQHLRWKASKQSPACGSSWPDRAVDHSTAQSASIGQKLSRRRCSRAQIPVFPISLRGKS